MSWKDDCNVFDVSKRSISRFIKNGKKRESNHTDSEIFQEIIKKKEVEKFDLNTTESGIDYILKKNGRHLAKYSTHSSSMEYPLNHLMQESSCW